MLLLAHKTISWQSRVQPKQLPLSPVHLYNMKRASFVSQFVVDRGVRSVSLWWLTLRNMVIYGGGCQADQTEMLSNFLNTYNNRIYNTHMHLVICIHIYLTIYIYIYYTNMLTMPCEPKNKDDKQALKLLQNASRLGFLAMCQLAHVGLPLSECRISGPNIV